MEEKKEGDEPVSEKELMEQSQRLIEKYGRVQLGVLARILSVDEGWLRQALLGAGFVEHEKNRFIYGKNFKRPVEAKATEPGEEEKKEEFDDWVVL